MRLMMYVAASVVAFAAMFGEALQEHEQFFVASMHIVNSSFRMIVC